MAVVYWEGKIALYEFDYDGGGGGTGHTPVAGEVVYVDTEEATEYATLQSWSVTGGAWATNDAAGKMWVYGCTAAFITNLENNDVIEGSDTVKICDTTGAVTGKEGDWQCAGNWGLGEDPAVPLADDEVIFDGRSTHTPSEGMLDGESGAVAQCTFDLLHFKSGWAGGVAGAAEPLICAPDRLIIDGTGTYYICCGKTDQSTDTNIDSTVVNNSSATVYLYSNANDGANTCTFTDVHLAAGTLYAAYYSVDTDDCGCWITNLYISPIGGHLSKATVYIEKDAYKVIGPVATNIKMLNGTVYTDTWVDEFDVFGGIVYFGTDLGSSPETRLNVDKLWLHGGTFYWQPDDSDDDAYIGELCVYGGLFSASGTTNSDRAKVLGDGANDIYLFPGAKMNLANSKGNITLAAGSTFYNLGGTLILDSNAAISLTYDT